MRRLQLLLWLVLTAPAAVQAQVPGSTPVNGTASYADVVMSRSVEDVIRGDKDLSTFAAAFDAAGLQAGLEGRGPFTVFVPNDAAFDRLPRSMRDEIMKNPEELRKLLRYHVVSGRNIKTQFLRYFDGWRLKTEAEQPVLMRTGGDVAYVSDFSKTARILGPGIEARNGVVHVVDIVLTPPTGDMGVAH